MTLDLFGLKKKREETVKTLKELVDKVASPEGSYSWEIAFKISIFTSNFYRLELTNKGLEEHVSYEVSNSHALPDCTFLSRGSRTIPESEYYSVVKTYRLGGHRLKAALK